MRKMRIFQTTLFCLHVYIAAQIEDRKVLSHDFNVRGKLEVENNAGNVTVVGSDEDNKITVEVIRHANTKEELELFDVKFDVSNKETKATIKSDNLKRVPNVSVDFNIIVPKHTYIFLDLDAGNANVQNILESIKIEVKDGNASVSGACEQVDVRIDSGNANIAYAAESFGQTHVKIENGTINVVNAGGSIDAKSDNGNIVIDQRVLPNKEKIDAKTDTGNIAIAIPTHANATIKAETKVGTITNAGLQWTRKTPKPLKVGEAPHTGDEARLVVGKGYADIDLAAKTGTISVTLK